MEIASGSALFAQARAVGLMMDAAARWGAIWRMMRERQMPDAGQVRRLMLARAYLTMFAQLGAATPVEAAEEYWGIVEAVEAEMSGRAGRD